jgi:hypothetical protein
MLEHTPYSGNVSSDLQRLIGSERMRDIMIGSTRKEEEEPASPETFEEAVESVLDDLLETMVSKQRDYGRGNIDAFGEIGVLVRASDKLARLKNLLHDNPGEPSNETLDDTWKDLANYGIIALMLRRGTWGLPLKDQE